MVLYLVRMMRNRAPFVISLSSLVKPLYAQIVSVVSGSTLTNVGRTAGSSGGGTVNRRVVLLRMKPFPAVSDDQTLDCFSFLSINSDPLMISIHFVPNYDI